MNTIGIQRELPYGFDEALVKIPEALKAQGFGVLTEISVHDVLKKKLGAEFRRYKILGACNPGFALQALQTRLEVGVLLPCNVVVFETDTGRATVIAVDPMQTLAAGDQGELAEIAEAVRTRLTAVVESL